jgi:serine/threonine protein phosphatase 1
LRLRQNQLRLDCGAQLVIETKQVPSTTKLVWNPTPSRILRSDQGKATAGEWRFAKVVSTIPGARLPDGIRIYAVGDLHGRLDLLDRLLLYIDDDLANFPAQRAIHVFLGDYIDRGPDSRYVLERLIQRGQIHEVVCLKGNHELFLIDFLRNPELFKQWRQYGGLDTLMSYGVVPPFNPSTEQLEALAAELYRAMPDEHVEFLDRLQSWFACGDYFFVHAGVRPGIALRDQQEKDLLWIRDEFLQSGDDFGKIIIHGHTPVASAEIRSNRINIDTGAYATGLLTCLILEGDKCWFMAA